MKTHADWVADLVEEVISQEKALLDEDVLQSEYQARTIWNGEKLVSQEEWDEQNRKEQGSL